IKEIPVNTRVITATSRLIEQMIKDNTFRQDLYYRINVLPIHVPPLKERYEDIPLLVDHFLSRAANQAGIHPKKMSDAALSKLFRHDWPGNIRELKNVIERASIITDNEIIDEAYILFGHDIEKTIKDLKSHHFNELSVHSLKEMVGSYEKGILKSVLKRYPSIRQSARALNMSHTAIINKIKKYGLESE
ncbi:MAG: sigma 54-interacting transcriptional regulator, partial [Desulfobacteraceae bacterium]|nr:sigma 54-interacting transcriptional regulator [Desulfobacteraceae bacterium]